MKTVRECKQVDVVYRRLDGSFLDPLSFRPDNTFGVVGLMSAYLSNNVVIANAPGTGVADDKSIYPYVDQLVSDYLDEKLILSNVPTCQCHEPDAPDYVLSH